jgi:signal transduction histidine kinase/CheY-like chemotaxis protein/HPt (histidine-containing phosphotransfer) domain-containing protein
MDSMVYVTDPKTDEIMFINKSMKEHHNIKDDATGKKCYEVLRKGINERCYFCPCHKLDKEPNSAVVWEERSNTTGRIYRNTDRYIEWLGGDTAHIQQSVDLTELIAAKEQAEQNSRFKSQFLSHMSHEIRTPMNAILGIAEIQLQDETLPQTVKEAFGRIYNSGDLLLGIINDILDLSKIESGRMELTPARYEVPSLIHDTVQLNIMRYENNPVKFELDVEENVPFELIGDEIRIKQILNNLLSNAFKYTKEGKINLSLFVEQNETVDNTGITLVFQVKDTGQGMTPEQIQKLGIDEYSRFNTQVNKTTEGTELGMNITRNIIQLMNGRITIKSKPDKGSVFTVYLPQKRTSSLRVIGKELADNLKIFNHNSASQIKKLQIIREFMPYGRVLVVDDVETNLYVARGLMAPYGLSIDSALSGFETIKKIEEGCVYDIIFMDHMMPKMDGIETIKILRDIGYTQPVVALTANALAGQEQMFIEHGFDGYIPKPIDVRHLNVILNKYIRDRQTLDVIEAAREQKSRLQTIVFNSSEKDPQLAEIFINDAKKAIVIFEMIYQNKFRRADDISMFIINVHAIKSALSNVGEFELSSSAFKLELAGRERNIEYILAELPLFINILRTTVDKIKLENENDKTIEEVDESDPEVQKYLKEKLLAIQTASLDYDKLTAEELLSELQQKAWSQPVKDFLAAAAIHILHSAFEDAAEEIRKYLTEIQTSASEK